MSDRVYMQRCLELAKSGCGKVAPNPMVGAVLVYNGRIIGEGYHQQYGQAHAEVKCIASVAEADKELIASSTLYVSLEPCAHFGKTPPCTDLIIRQKIPKVVVGCTDPFKQVSGKGIEKLRAAGISVETGILEKECIDLNKRFFIFQIEHRPYIILKWAQTADQKISSGNNERLLISNEYSNRLVHKWRSEEAAILIGTNTALLDNPELTTRLWPGRSPVRLVLDMDLRLPSYLKIFNRHVRTIIFNSIKDEEDNGLLYYRLNRDGDIVGQMMNALFELNIQSVLVEGGSQMLQTFINEKKWDEARVITNQQLRHPDDKMANNGLTAPLLPDALLQEEIKLGDDIIKTFMPNETGFPLQQNN